MVKELNLRLKQVEFNGSDHSYVFRMNGVEVTAEDKDGDGVVGKIRITDDKYAICARAVEFCDFSAVFRGGEALRNMRAKVQGAVTQFRTELSGELAKVKETLKDASRHNVISEYSPDHETGGQQAGDRSDLHVSDYDRDGLTDHIVYESSKGVRVFISQMEFRNENQVLKYIDPTRGGVLTWLQPFDVFWPEARASK